VRNASGRWRLRLAQPSHVQLLLALTAVDAREAITRNKRRPLCADTSQRGDGSNFRNVQMDGVPLDRWLGIDNSLVKTSCIAILLATGLPPAGCITFDYVSTARPPKDAHPMEDWKLEARLREVGWLRPLSKQKGDAAMTPRQPGRRRRDLLSVAQRRNLTRQGLEATPNVTGDIDEEIMLPAPEEVPPLHQALADVHVMISCGGWLSCMQVICLCDIAYALYPSDQVEVQACLVCSAFSRIVDAQRIRPVLLRHLCKETVSSVLHRLGPLNLFNPLWAGGRYKLELRHADERSLLKLMMDISVAAHDHLQDSPDTTIPVRDLFGKANLPTQGRIVVYYANCEQHEEGEVNGQDQAKCSGTSPQPTNVNTGRKTTHSVTSAIGSASKSFSLPMNSTMKAMLAERMYLASPNAQVRKKFLIRCLLGEECLETNNFFKQNARF